MEFADMKLDEDSMCKLEDQQPFLNELLVRYKDCINDKYDRETVMYKILDVLDPFITEMLLKGIQEQFDNFATSCSVSSDLFYIKGDK